MKKSETELGNWYSNIVSRAELADYGSTRGDIVIRPYGFAIWQRIIDILNERLLKTGHQQAYFPLLLPEKLISDEIKYIDGLSPRLFTVTHAGEGELKEHLVIRPSSETIVNYMFAKWVNSYRDLPLKMYQWSNIARWEERTRPFIKGREILWLEGHTVHYSHEDALDEIVQIRAIFQDILEKVLAIPVLFGCEPETRKFIGSVDTFTAESIMPNGQALQLAAVYDLGQIFSHALEVSFQNAENQTDYCWATNWGLGFRLIGALILIHGDERGMRLPPNIAPMQVVIVPILDSVKNTESIQKLCDDIHKTLISSDIRVHISNLEFRSVKHAIEYWEMKGIPEIILVGKNEVLSGRITIIRRDFELVSNKVECDISILKDVVLNILNEIQNSLYEQALRFQTENTAFINSFDELNKGIEGGWVIGYWCSSKECENKIIEQFGKIIRCTIQDSKFTIKNNICLCCGSPADSIVLFAKSY